MKTQRTLDSLLHSLHGASRLEQPRATEGGRAAPHLPFVTISRQAGAGGETLAKRLVDRLNAVDPAGALAWTTWDRELVQKVAAEYHVPEPLVESIGSGGRSLWREFLDGFQSISDPQHLDEFQLYRRVAAIIRSLAHAGRAVVVGRGGVYATNDIPGGVHVRLVAPLEYRIERMARVRNVSEQEAADEVRRRDRARETFHRRYWPGSALLPEIFTITLNTAAVPEETLIECILPLIPAGNPASTRPCPPRREATPALAGTIG